MVGHAGIRDEHHGFRDGGNGERSVRVPLNESRTITLDGSGNGTARLSPLSAREVWYPVTVHVSTIQSVVTNEATCKIYVGDVAITQNYRDTTFSGSSGDSTGKVSSDKVQVSDGIFAVWTGGDPGVSAVMVVTGERDI